jgi:hypothetical protein
VQVYEILQILLQESRTHARDGDTIAVVELNHCVAMHVGSDRGSQILHIMNVGEVVELDRLVLRIEIVDHLRAFARMEHKSVLLPIETEGLDGELASGGSKIRTLSPTCLTTKSLAVLPSV